MARCQRCGLPLGPDGTCSRCSPTTSIDPATWAPTAADPTLPTARPSPERPPVDPMIGRDVIGQYRIVRKLGQGGMGGVYLAEQPAIDRKVAIKVLHPWCSGERSIVERFHTEATAVARLHNPHIVQIHNFGSMEDGSLFIAMEYVQGVTLAETIRTVHQLPPERAIDIALQCCEALEHAHRLGVVHRDFKPANVMLEARSDGRDFVKVLDFGIAKLEGSQPTRSGELFGTPQYMAPEQLAGQGVDRRTDVYALGLVLYEMLCGRPPFIGDTPISYAVLHLHEPPPPLRRFAPHLAEATALQACLARALAKQAAQRQPSAEAFGLELAHARAVPKRSAPPSKTAVAIAIGATVAALAGTGAAVGLVFLRDDPPVEPLDTPPPVASDVDPVVRPSVEQPRADEAMLAKLSPETRALLDKDVATLETELWAVLDAFPPATKRQIQDSYALQIAMPPPGTDTEWYRKYLLVQWIATFRSSAAQLPSDERTLAELERDYVAMNGKTPAETRKMILDNIKANLPADENRDWQLRITLIQLIKQEQQ